ncbi:DUF2288 family protein [Pseudomonas aeruginosa]
MTEQTSPLYAKLLGETAVISWAELQPFFARGALLQVDAALDLVEVAEALAGDDREKVAAWLSGGGLSKVGEDAAKDFLERDPTLWAVVVAPWVVIQERAEKATLH